MNINIEWHYDNKTPTMPEKPTWYLIAVGGVLCPIKINPKNESFRTLWKATLSRFDDWFYFYGIVKDDIDDFDENLVNWQQIHLDAIQWIFNNLQENQPKFRIINRLTQSLNNIPVKEKRR